MKNTLVWICGWWFKYNGMGPFIWVFRSGGKDNVLERYICCNVAHAKRILHIKHPSNISNAML